MINQFPDSHPLINKSMGLCCMSQTVGATYEENRDANTRRLGRSEEGDRKTAGQQKAGA